MLSKNQQKFVEFLVRNGVLLFGEFMTKSGRQSPYFFNLGRVSNGEGIVTLGQYYTKAITEYFGSDFDIIFGPAYKGIPLAVSIIDSLFRDFNLNKKYCSNRKEVKNYGEQSAFLGAELKEGDKVILVDDVLTTGETKFGAVNLIQTIHNVEIKGLVIALDRQESDNTGANAVSIFSQKTGIPVKSMINIREVVEYLHRREIDGRVWIDDEIKLKVEEYLKKYGQIKSL